MSRPSELASRYRISDGSKFRLKSINPADTNGLKSKQSAASALKKGVERLALLQERLYAQDRWSILLIFQAMDAAGKDGTIKHVMSGSTRRAARCTPSSRRRARRWTTTTCGGASRCCRGAATSASSTAPTTKKRWSSGSTRVPGRAAIPTRLVSKDIWKERFEDIRNVERYLARQGVVIRKFFLHVSKDEQRALPGAARAAGEELEVLARRLNEREHFDDYMRPTRTSSAPPPPSGRRGTSSRPTTSGSRGW